MKLGQSNVTRTLVRRRENSVRYMIAIALLVGQYAVWLIIDVWTVALILGQIDGRLVIESMNGMYRL